jgi:hypothetical protein
MAHVPIPFVPSVPLGPEKPDDMGLGAIFRPSMTEARVTPAQTRAAIDLARGHAHRQALGALAFDLLSRQAEAGALFSGREFVEARAREHQVDRTQADTDAGNLLGVLERGPQTEPERALVLAFAVDGLRQRLDDAGADGRDRILSRFVRHADWLAASTPLDPYPFVQELVDGASRETIWSMVAREALRDTQPCPAARARNAARLAVLLGSEDPAAAAARERMAQECADPVTARWAQSTLDGASQAGGDIHAHPRVRGCVGRAPRASTRDVLRIVFGVAALQWLLRALGRLVGLRREAEVELVSGGVRVRRRTSLLGRTLRDAEETYALSAVARAGRLVRYPALPLLAGLLALSVGVLLGGLWLFEGIRSGETVLLLIAAGAILLGAGLDLLLSVLLPGRRGRVALDLQVLSGRGIRLLRVPQADADRFLEALSRQLV